MTTENMLNQLEYKYEMATYLTKLVKIADPFKKELSPPTTVKSQFISLFRGWIDREIKNLVEPPAPIVEKDIGIEKLSDNEIFAMRQFIQRMTQRETVLAKPAIAERRGPVMRPLNATEAVHMPQDMPATGGEIAYIVDPSSIGNPDISAGTKVQIVGTHPTEPSIRIVRSVGDRKSIQFSTSIDNLTKENI